MAKFRKKAESVVAKKVINHMGGVSYAHPAKEELALALVTSFIDESYYEKSKDRIKRLRELVKAIAEKDPVFLTKLAVVTRKEFHMRSAFHVLIGEFARAHRGDNLVRKALAIGAERPDDISEVMAYLKKPIPNAIKKGAADALRKFDAYQLAKYRGSGRDFSMVDVFNIVHPSPKGLDKSDAQAWSKLMEDKLRSKKTWEADLSAAGKEEGDVAENKKEAWENLVESGKIGYMALLRNLRNILELCDDKTIRIAAERIADRDAVLKSKQLPFRFLSAWIELGKTDDGRAGALKFEKGGSNVKILRDAVARAVEYAVENIPLLQGKTVILSDNSGSMHGDFGGNSLVSAMSDRKTADIANLFALLYWLRADNTYVGLFGDELKEPKLDRKKNIFENFESLNQTARTVGGGTEAGVFTAFEKLIASRQKVDRIVIFSDQQIGRGCGWYDTNGRHGNELNKLFAEYRKINPDVVVYSVDLRGYGDNVFADNAIKLGGWSEKIFDLMNMAERKGGLVKYIENYDLEEQPVVKKVQKRKATTKRKVVRKRQ